MRKLLVTYALAALIVLVSSVGLGWFYWDQRTIWPEFAPPAQDNPLAPQVVADVERDFGWRTGDRIYVDLYIKQQKGTSVDLNTFAIQGDFEVSGEPDVTTRDRKDGTKLVRYRIPVQAFNLKPNWKLNATMTYRIEGVVDDQLITLPALALHTSPTWDGRKEIKEESAKPVFGYDLLLNAAIILGGIALLVVSIKVYRRAASGIDDPPVFVSLSPRHIARRDFLAVWALIKAGDVREENYKEIERIFRRLYRLEARTMRELKWEMNNHLHRDDVVRILSLCDQVLYSRHHLNDAEHEEIWEAFNRMLPSPAELAARASLVKAGKKK